MACSFIHSFIIQVRAIVGPQSYLLQASEVLYEKVLTPLIEEILRYVYEKCY